MIFTICNGGHAMKTSKFTEAQIAFALKQAELGTKVEEVCRKLNALQLEEEVRRRGLFLRSCASPRASSRASTKSGAWTLYPTHCSTAGVCVH
ncbi:transposase [Ralstonia pseudosolanacearum]